ncbi:hypothetical protein BEN47_15210 [Hymenobacter lapidarius]|uniref:Serine aminopeptidase S33 domain-containing protein n=1 Tax=Hymenobacter lapidarius TaxID=1908237 RepID=A0A1G1T391_9BACT|nr:alpha/beta hydrolase [Hymenobacter lapidarius]OGX85304.1 hypothetical protein BEN47_15210 [Hymenobacter lapidarius]
MDSSRNRVIPVAVYYPAVLPASAATGGQPPKLKLAVLSHGYGVKNTEYSFVARHLVAHGYYVASLQQDLPTDAPIPQGGDVHQTRYPYWKRGVENIAFAIRALRRRTLVLDGQPVLLLGHSYGGDIAMLFAQEHPALAQRVISFDNCRVPLPRTRQPRIFSLRSSDQAADPGVVPTSVEQAEFGMTIIKLAATPHNKMCDAASARQKQEMNQWVSRFLETE